MEGFDLGELYSGVIPIDMKNTSRGLFFVYQPRVGDPVDEITIWLNGGPGTENLLQNDTNAEQRRMQLSRRLLARERQVPMGLGTIHPDDQRLLLGQSHKYALVKNSRRFRHTVF
jgi:hypothetical protein